jgi:Ser/Thr protein kinase RdoA (MazF antagonist)
MMTGDSFAIAYSTLACHALTTRVLPLYEEVSSITTCFFWNRGLSDVYLIETPSKPFILRISHHHWRSQSEIAFELEWLEFLRQQQMPVAYPLRTKDGRLSVEIEAPEGKRYAALFIYAPGKIALGDLNPIQANILGETVAKLHQVSTEFRSQAYRAPLSLDYLLDDSLQAVLPFLQQRQQDLHYLVEVVHEIKSQFQFLPQEPPFWVVCWGDPHSGNAHFTPDNRVTLFDFDQCGYGWRAFEIGKFLQVALSTGVSPNIRNAFLAGYQSVLPLTDWELASLQNQTQMAYIWNWAISLNNALMNNYSKLDDHYFHHRIQQLKMLRSPEWNMF